MLYISTVHYLLFAYWQIRYYYYNYSLMMTADGVYLQRQICTIQLNSSPQRVGKATATFVLQKGLRLILGQLHRLNVSNNLIGLHHSRTS